MMRIITGKARGVKLSAPAGEETTRPTAERTKEAIFSMIQFETEGREVLDLFAGSGQLGMEALSRGARSAVFVDASAEAVSVIEKNLLKTRLAPEAEVVKTDYRDFLRRCKNRRKFDLVFLDPPYAMGALPVALGDLLAWDLLLPGALLICETASPEDVFGGDQSLAKQFEVRRQTRYGAAQVTLLFRSGEVDA